MWLKRRQEPWRFGARVTSIARAALELRMRLLPYLYALFHEGEASGAPIWRPLWYEFPEDREAAQVEDQVMIGPWLMAAPVLERSTSEREVYLPAGVWLDWQSDARFVGPRRVRVAAPLERMPLFVRGGAVIATQSPTRHARERPLEPLVLEVYPGADGESCLYEDDGETTAYRDPADGGRAALARTRFRLRDRAGGRLRLEIGRREGDFGIEPRPLRIAMHGCPSPEAVFSDGERLPESNQAPGYRCEAGTIQIRLIDRGESRSVETEPAP
jgi:alpha-glucosidase